MADVQTRLLAKRIKYLEAKQKKTNKRVKKIKKDTKRRTGPTYANAAAVGAARAPPASAVLAYDLQHVETPITKSTKRPKKAEEDKSDAQRKREADFRAKGKSASELRAAHPDWSWNACMGVVQISDPSAQASRAQEIMRQGNELKALNVKRKIAGQKPITKKQFLNGTHLKEDSSSTNGMNAIQHAAVDVGGLPVKQQKTPSKSALKKTTRKKGPKSKSHVSKLDIFDVGDSATSDSSDMSD